MASARSSNAWVASFAACAGVLAFWLAMLTTRRGLELGPDAWSYWTASVSLLEGRGYVDGHGLAVHAWPPGYSIWLACVQRVAGVSMASVRLADALTIGAVALLGTVWAARRTAARSPMVVAAIASAMVVGCVAVVRGPGAESLMLALLFALLLLLDAPVLGVRRWLVAAALLVAMVSTRHVALAFVPALCFVVPPMRRARRPVPGALLLATAVGAWATLAHWLAQARTIAPLVDTQSPREVLLAMASGLDRGIAPFPLGMLVFVLAWLGFGPARARTRRLLAVPDAALPEPAVGRFVLTALAGIAAMFLCVHVADPAGPRFVRFGSLMTCATVVGVAAQVPRRAVRWSLLAVLLLPATGHVAKHAVLGRECVDSVGPHGGATFLPLHAVPGPHGVARQLLPDGRLQVPTPLFDWQRSRLMDGGR